jgi:hypothetical protein
MANVGAGAAAGAAAGSVVPGIGTAIGALGGAAISAIGNFFGNRSNRKASAEAFERESKFAREEHRECLTGRYYSYFHKNFSASRKFNTIADGSRTLGKS